MASSLSKLVNNRPEGIHRIKFKYRHDKKCETCGIRYKHCYCLIEYTDFKDDLIEHKCLCSDKNHQHKFDAKLEKRLFDTYKFRDYGNNKFILLVREGVYPYE